MLYPAVNRQKIWLSILLALIIVCNLYFHFSFQGTLENRVQYIDSAFAKVFYPIQWTFDWSEQRLKSSVSLVGRLWDADQENQALKDELSKMKVELQLLAEIKAERDQLLDQLSFKKGSSLHLLAARIIARDPSLFFKTLEIDRGEKDGIQGSMAVVSPAGAVGRILKVYDHTSTVLLITDMNSRIDSIVERSRSRVIVGGASDGDLNLRYLPRRFDLREGDVILTSGMGGFFPPGFKVGVVVGLARDPHFVLEQASVEPAVDFDSLENVFVVQTIARWP